MVYTWCLNIGDLCPSIATSEFFYKGRKNQASIRGTLRKMCTLRNVCGGIQAVFKAQSYHIWNSCLPWSDAESGFCPSQRITRDWSSNGFVGSSISNNYWMMTLTYSDTISWLFSFRNKKDILSPLTNGNLVLGSNPVSPLTWGAATSNLVPRDYKDLALQQVCSRLLSGVIGNTYMPTVPELISSCNPEDITHNSGSNLQKNNCC